MSRLVSKTFRASVALLLSLWITGAGCMFGCGEMMAATASEPAAAATEDNSFATIVSGDACASHGSHDCCAKKKAATKQASPVSTTAKPSLQTAALLSLSEYLKPAPGSGMSECPLATSRAVAITRTSDRKPQIAAILFPSSAPILSTVSELDAAVLPIARLPNRGHTYLRCCAFLI